MQPQKFRWSRVYESSEEELQSFLHARSIIATTHHLDGGLNERIDIEPQTTIWCAEGSFTLIIDNLAISMQPGDAVTAKSLAATQLQSGISGCIYYLSS